MPLIDFAGFALGFGIHTALTKDRFKLPADEPTRPSVMRVHPAGMLFSTFFELPAFVKKLHGEPPWAISFCQTRLLQHVVKCRDRKIDWVSGDLVQYPKRLY